MMHKKHLFTFLLSLFVLFSTYGKGNVVSTHQKNGKQSEVLCGTISQHPGPNAEQELISSEGILHTSVRNTENYRPNFQHHSNNKGLFHVYASRFAIVSNTSLLAYSSNKMAHSEASPHYIAFRQLLI